MPKFGMYSAEAAKKHGTLIYSSAIGGEVAITAVVENPDSYKWPDAVNLGEVGKFLRDGFKPTEDFLESDTYPEVSSALKM